MVETNVSLTVEGFYKIKLFHKWLFTLSEFVSDQEPAENKESQSPRGRDCQALVDCWAAQAPTSQRDVPETLGGMGLMGKEGSIIGRRYVIPAKRTQTDELIPAFLPSGANTKQVPWEEQKASILIEGIYDNFKVEAFGIFQGHVYVLLKRKLT